MNRSVGKLSLIIDGGMSAQGHMRNLTRVIHDLLASWRTGSTDRSVPELSSSSRCESPQPVYLLIGGASTQ